MAANAVGPLGGPLVACAAGHHHTGVPAAAPPRGLARSSDYYFCDHPPSSRCGGSWGCTAAFTQNFPAAQKLSNYLLVMLQYWGLGPGLLLCTYLLLQTIKVQVKGRVRAMGRQREHKQRSSHSREHSPHAA